jgi:hypothetical protein
MMPFSPSETGVGYLLDRTTRNLNHHRRPELVSGPMPQSLCKSGGIMVVTTCEAWMLKRVQHDSGADFGHNALIVILDIELERAIWKEGKLALRPWLLAGDGHGFA